MVMRPSLASTPKGYRSVVPPALDQLAVAAVPRTEGQDLHALRSGLERAHDARRDPERVQRSELEDLVVELDPSRSIDDDVDLLGVLVPVPERLTLAGLEPLVADPGVLGVEVGPREACLLHVADAESRGDVLDLHEVLERVGSGH